MSRVWAVFNSLIRMLFASCTLLLVRNVNVFLLHWTVVCSLKILNLKLNGKAFEKCLFL